MEETGTTPQAPIFFSDSIDKLLGEFLDMGLSECQFWEMTFAELNNYSKSYQRVQKYKAQEKALADYQLANLIGYSMARLFSKEVKYPEIYDAYPAIFDKEMIEEAREKDRQKKTNQWLTQFAQSFNQSHKKEVKEIANE